MQSIETRNRKDRSAGSEAATSPSSFDRFVAAAIARIISGCRPSSPISTSSAAAVVPPGEVTFWRNVAA